MGLFGNADPILIDANAIIDFLIGRSQTICQNYQILPINKRAGGLIKTGLFTVMVLGLQKPLLALLLSKRRQHSEL
jgi:hypothetical protein